MVANKLGGFFRTFADVSPGTRINLLSIADKKIDTAVCSVASKSDPLRLLVVLTWITLESSFMIKYALIKCSGFPASD